MIIVQIAAAVFGAALVIAVLISSLETVVLPRNGFTRISRSRLRDRRPALGQAMAEPGRRDNLRGLYAPVSLVSLPLVWMLTVTVGFTFIFWGIKRRHIERSFEVSGSSLTTLDSPPPTAAAKSG